MASDSDVELPSSGPSSDNLPCEDNGSMNEDPSLPESCVSEDIEMPGSAPDSDLSLPESDPGSGDGGENSDALSDAVTLGSSSHAVPSPTTLVLSDYGGSQDVAEFYSVPRVVPVALALGLSGVFSLDILTGWDFRVPEYRQVSLDLLSQVAIYMLILSPPCTVFSSLMQMWNYKKMDPEKVASQWKTGMVFLEHAMRAAEVQMARGLHFAFEHPAGATSWQQSCVQRVAERPGVLEVAFDQCMLGLKSKVQGTPMRKRTRILTNSPWLVHQLQGCQCDKTHVHQRIIGSEGGVSRSVWAQCYPPGLTDALARSCMH